MPSPLRFLWMMLALAAGLALSGCIVEEHHHHREPPPAVIIRAN